MATATRADPAYLARQAAHRSATVTVGAATVRLADVASYAIEVRVERDWDGQWLCVIAYGLIGAMFLIGVTVMGMDKKFLLAVFFFVAIAAMSLGDALAAKPVETWRLEMVTGDGRRLAYVAAEREAVERLAWRIDAAGGG